MKAGWMFVCLLIALVGCRRPTHDMADQPRMDDGEASGLFANGMASRLPPPGTVPQGVGNLAATSGGRRNDGRLEAGDALGAPSKMPSISLQLLRRGQDRYAIYCAPCHSPAGDGDGLVARRGFPHPPSFHETRLREVEDRHIYDVITHGYGIMSAYADRVSEADRWAIVAYVRALQLSQHASASELPEALRARLAVAQAGSAASIATGWTAVPEAGR